MTYHSGAPSIKKLQETRGSSKTDLGCIKFMAQALRAVMPQAACYGFKSVLEEGSSPELAASGDGLPAHWLRAQYGSVGSSNGHRSPVRSLAISIPDEDAGYKEGE